MRLSSIHERIPENSQFSSCRSLCLAMLCVLWEGHGGAPRVSSGSWGLWRLLSLQAGSHPRHSHPAHPSPLTLQFHLQDSPQNTQCSEQEIPGIPDSRQILQFHTHRSHRGPVSDEKTLGGLKTKINLTKNKWILSPGHQPGSCRDCQTHRHPPSIPASLLWLVILVLPRIKSNSVLFMSLNIAQTYRHLRLGWWWCCKCSLSGQFPKIPTSLSFSLEWWHFVLPSHLKVQHWELFPLPGLGCEHFKAIFVVLLKKKKKSKVWFGIPQWKKIPSPMFLPAVR